ncbi:DNA mismatch repair protein [bacterium]|nr:MAG: DNA mismatch repair protein [bacterium]
MPDESRFTFEISLSVLNHLGRNLYRSFITVLGEAVSNSWDADAENVWIYIDREQNFLIIKDDGDGMTANDFQNKFLKIGYSKRKDGKTKSRKDRPYIGRKGIGKLAMLSCADRISVISKTKNSDYVGGTIDNTGLDDAIKEDLTPQEYPLENFNITLFEPYIEDHAKGTIVYFENIKDGIKNTIDYLKKTLALYFRFSLIDDSFKLFLNNEPITSENLDDLAVKTQFIWLINSLEDPYIRRLKEKFPPLEEKQITIGNGIVGFIASVKKPSHLKITGTDERVGVDLFANGRLREKDILEHIPTNKYIESYLYGQIHFDELDDEQDRFATAREGIVANDDKFNNFLKIFREQVLRIILEDWDIGRVKYRDDGDSENMRITKKQRKSIELFNAVAEDYTEPPSDLEPQEVKDYQTKVEGWINELSTDAQFNFSSYADCFVSENLIRKFIIDKNIDISSVQNEIEQLKMREKTNKDNGNINIELRQKNIDISYLDMEPLAKLADTTGVENCLHKDAKQYKPIRNALMHTARLTEDAKEKLTTVYKNIKGRIIKLLSGSD